MLGVDGERYGSRTEATSPGAWIGVCEGRGGVWGMGII